MPLTLTETDEFAAEVVGTMDGDAANYGTFNRAPTTNASRTRYLYNRSVPAKGGTLPLQLWTPIINESSTWALALNGASPGAPRWYATAENTDALWLAVPIEAAALLESVVIYVEGAAGHSGLPAVMPSASLVELDATEGFAGSPDTTIATATDSSGTVAAYQTSHTITLTPATPIAPSQSTAVVLRLVGESGANAISGYTLWGGYATYLPGAGV